MGKTVLFIHIPKAAGSTLQTIVRRQYRWWQVYTIGGSDISAAVQKFRSLPERKRKHLRLVMGHMPYGIHECVPRPSAYFTLMRHPVYRMLSHYQYVRRTATHYLHEAVTKDNLSFREYSESELSSELHNGQARLLAGLTGADGMSEDVFATARANLDSFATVGIAESFDESVLLMQHRFGWGTPYYVKKNVTPPAATPSIDSYTRQAILERNEVDVALYQYATDRLRTEVAEEGPAFQLKLEQLRKMNQHYMCISPLLSLSGRVRRNAARLLQRRRDR